MRWALALALASCSTATPNLDGGADGPDAAVCLPSDSPCIHRDRCCGDGNVCNLFFARCMSCGAAPAGSVGCAAITDCCPGYGCEEQRCVAQ